MNRTGTVTSTRAPGIAAGGAGNGCARRTSSSFTAAVYDLDRSNQRLADPNNPGFFILSGKTNAKGFETGLVGAITDPGKCPAATPTRMPAS